MKLGPACARLGLAVPYLALAAVALAFFGDPVVPPAPSGSTGAPTLIVTTEALRAPFEALEGWNRERGCASVVIGLTPGRGSGSMESMVAYLGALCARRGGAGLLLGGDQRLVPLWSGLGEDAGMPGTLPVHPPGPGLIPVPTAPGDGLPAGLRVGRAPVRNLAEAWAFVDFCRADGRTLDQMLGAAPGPALTARAGGGSPLLLAPAAGPR